MTTQRGADRSCRDLHAKPEQLTLDPLVAPAGILGRQADNQLLQLLVERPTSASAMRVGPRARDQTAVPAKQRRTPRGDEQLHASLLAPSTGPARKTTGGRNPRVANAPVTAVAT